MYIFMCVCMEEMFLNDMLTRATSVVFLISVLFEKPYFNIVPNSICPKRQLASGNSVMPVIHFCTCSNVKRSEKRIAYILKCYQ